MMPNKAKVAHLVHTLGRGGIETWLVGILPYMKKSEFDCEVIVTGPAEVGQLSRILSEQGIPIRWCPVPRKVLPSYNLCQMLGMGDYDIIHFHYAEGGIGCHLSAALSSKAKRVLHLHSPRVSSKRGLSTVIALKAFRMWIKVASHCVIGNSEGTLGEYYRETWKRKRHVHLLYLGVSPERFRMSEEARNRVRNEFMFGESDIVVGHVGSYGGFEKNQDIVIHSLAALLRKGIKAKALMVGDGPDLNRIKLLAERENVIGACSFTGEREDVEALYCGMDVFLFPSRYEGFGLASLEAQACGTPVVISDIPGLRESIVFPRQCKIVTEMTPETFAEACLQVAGTRIVGKIPLTHQLCTAATGLASIYRDLIGGA